MMKKATTKSTLALLAATLLLSSPTLAWGWKSDTQSLVQNVHNCLNSLEGQSSSIAGLKATPTQDGLTSLLTYFKSNVIPQCKSATNAVSWGNSPCRTYFVTLNQIINWDFPNIHSDPDGFATKVRLALSNIWQAILGSKQDCADQNMQTSQTA